MKEPVTTPRMITEFLLRLGPAAGLIALAAACARMGSPPGGPEDKEPPAVETFQPAPDSTGIAPGSRLAVVFSEKVRRETAEPLVRLVPPAGRLFFNWDGRRVEIRPADSLRPDMTYRLSVAAGLEDLHRVKSEKRFESWFSTGGSFAPGKLGGSLKVNDSIAVAALVMAVSSADSALAFDTQSDSGGVYRFPYLPLGQYRLTAWRDANRNRQFEFTREEGADSLITLGLEPLTVDFTLLLADTTAPRLRSVETPDSLTVVLVFDDRLDSLKGLANAGFEVRSPDSLGALLAVDSVKLDSLDAARVKLLLSRPLDPAGRYYVSFTRVVNRASLEALPGGRSFSFKPVKAPAAGGGRQR